MRKNVNKDERIHIFVKGAWDKKEMLYVQRNSEHGVSAIGKEADYAVELDCIDDCIGTDIEITHIKMDIEGGVYVLNDNTGFTNLGISHDTPEFTGESVAQCVGSNDKWNYSIRPDV